MPPKGSEARAAALAEVGTLLHGLATDPALKLLLGCAEKEPLDDFQRANLREMRRDWRANNALPSRLVEARSLASSSLRARLARQRPANDWAGFAPNFLRTVVELAREEAQRLSQATGLRPTTR
jgi:carboxypeptidase Taq